MDKIVTIMKGKILVLLAVICNFTACVNEELINPSEGEDIVITAALSTDTIQAKATKGGEGESLLIQDEKILNNTLVLVFKNDASKNCIGFAEGTGNSLSVKTKIGLVHIVAIANAEESLLADLRTLYNGGRGSFTFVDFKTKFTQQLLTDSKNLIKVKVRDDILTRENDKKNYPIELIHLPARIEVKMVAKGREGENWMFDMTGFEVSKISTQSALILPEVYGDGYSYNARQNHAGLLTSDNATGSKLTFYSYEKETGNEPIKVKVKGTLISVDTAGNPLETISGKEYTFDLDPKEEGLSVTAGIVHGYAYLVTGNIDAKKPGISLQIKVVPMNKISLDVDYGEGEEWEN